VECLSVDPVLSVNVLPRFADIVGQPRGRPRRLAPTVPFSHPRGEQLEIRGAPGDLLGHCGSVVVTSASKNRRLDVTNAWQIYFYLTPSFGDNTLVLHLVSFLLFILGKLVNPCMFQEALTLAYRESLFYLSYSFIFR